MGYMNAKNSSGGYVWNVIYKTCVHLFLLWESDHF